MKRKLILGSLSLVSIVFCLYLAILFSKVKIQSNYGNEVSYGFKSQNDEFIDSQYLKSFQLNLQEKDAAHFSKLKRLIKKQDFKTYQELNVWKNATITLNSKETHVQIKLHGRTPANHTFKEFISYKVKSPIAINGLKDFNLIIYERIGPCADRIMMLGDSLELISQEDELIQLQINDSENHLYYFERPTKQEFLEEHRLINYELGDLKSPITSNQFNVKTIDSLLQKEAVSDKIRLFYFELNTSIEAGNQADIHNYFDIDYISRFQLARSYAGFTNHGFTPENLLFALDTTKMKLYPILHRDNYFGDFNKRNFNRNESGQEIQILRLLSNNAKILDHTEKHKEANPTKLRLIRGSKTRIDQFHEQLYR